MDYQFDKEYLESLSLFDLRELQKFYSKLSGDVYNPNRPAGIDQRLRREREEMIDVAIRYKLCSLDAKLFGSSILENTEEYVKGRNR